MDKYDEVIERARLDYVAAREVYREASGKRIAALEELNSLTAEADELRSQLADFQAGNGGPMTAEEYQTAAYRVQWLTGAIKAQSRIKAGFESEEGSAARALQNIHGAARNRIDELLRNEAEAAATARRAQLEAALK